MNNTRDTHVVVVWMRTDFTMRALLLLSVAGLATASNSTCSDTSSLYTEEMVALRGQHSPV